MLQENQEILEGRFKIIKKLGSGAFGEIFKGKFTYTMCLKKGFLPILNGRTTQFHAASQIV